MPDKHLDNTRPFGRRNGPPRNKVLGAALTVREKQRVVQALDQAGFQSESEGVREIVFAFAHSAVVRDAVSQYRRERAAA